MASVPQSPAATLHSVASKLVGREGKVSFRMGEHLIEANVVTVSFSSRVRGGAWPDYIMVPEHVITMTCVGDFEQTAIILPPRPIEYTVRENFTIQPRPWWAFWRSRGGRRVKPASPAAPPVIARERPAAQEPRIDRIIDPMGLL